MIQTVKIYRSHRDAARMLSEHDRLLFWDALIDYALDGTEPEIDGQALMLFTAIRPTIDSRNEFVEYGEKGGRPKKETGVSGNQKGGFSEKGKGPSENSKTYEYEYEYEYEKDKDKKEKSKRFVPPTIEEVRAYVREKGYTFDPEAFVAFYESNGWKVGRNQMKDWRGACRTWQSRQKPVKPEKVEPRSYDFDDLERQIYQQQKARAAI